jgi:hypothetical protein
MIRTPAPRDLILIRKLQGVVLPPEEALIDAYSPLRATLLSSLNPFRSGFFQTITYVLSQRRGERLRGIAQVQENQRRATAQVVYLAPDGGWEEPATWPQWLDDLCQKMGERETKRLLVHLPAEDDRLVAFQRAAFHIYTHEDLFHLANARSEMSSEQGPGLRRRRAADAWGLARLYNAVTPPVVQQAEGLSQAGQDEAICVPLASRGTRGYVLEIEQEILGYAEARCGSRGAWVRFLLHPQAGDMAETLVRGALSRLTDQRVYCGLPDYQGGVRSALQSVGFEPFGRQALLVRYIAVFARRSVAELVGAVEKGAEVIAPVARANESCRVSSQRSAAGFQSVCDSAR